MQRSPGERSYCKRSPVHFTARPEASFYRIDREGATLIPQRIVDGVPADVHFVFWIDQHNRGQGPVPGEITKDKWGTILMDSDTRLACTKIDSNGRHFARTL